MARKNKALDAAEKAPVENAPVDPAMDTTPDPGAATPVPEPGAVMAMPLPVPGVRDSMLFQLYAARVANAETLQTIRRDKRAIFAEALCEAKTALDVFTESMEGKGNE